MGYFANGTEGEMYQAQYCGRCIHGTDQCSVLELHMLHNYEDCQKKDSPLHVLIPRGENGVNEQCTMFVNRQILLDSATGERKPPRPERFEGLHPIFRECVCYESTRYALHRPFAQNGAIYASDGRIAVRMDAPSDDLLARYEYKPGKDGRRLPNVTELFSQVVQRDTVPTPLPDFEGDGRVECPDCWGHGHYHGRPDTICEGCDGKGRLVTEAESLPVGRQTFALYYLSLLKRNGVTGLYLSQNMAPSRNRDCESSRFELPGITGLLMGTRPGQGA